MPNLIKINGETVRKGEKKQLNLNTYRLPTRTIVEVPVFVTRSQKDGPVLLIQGGMHGDEVNGIEIVRKLLVGQYFDRLLCGTVIAIPTVNTISFLNHSRELPDGRDLNRCFPGTKTGSLGSRIAYDLMKQILPQIDFGVDFHTGGAKINNYPQLRCVFEDAKNLELSKMFGAPFIIDSPYRDKSFRKEAAKKGKSILVYEAGESARFNKLAVSEGVNGCLRLMNNLKMIKTNAPKSMTITLNDTKWIRAKIAGLFRTTKKYGSFIEKNTVIGTISDPYGEIEEELVAPENCFIIGINNQPVINEGDALINIGME